MQQPDIDHRGYYVDPHLQKEFGLKYERYMSLGIRSMGFDTCVLTLARFINAHPGKHIISIGSGNAIVEYICSHITARDIICVDPRPLSFNINNGLVRPFIEPAYSTVDELLEKRPECADRSIVYFGWCSPSSSTYDYDALIKLNPIAFLALTGTIHVPCLQNDIVNIGGGKKFFDFLFEQEESKEYVCISSNLCSIETSGLIEGYSHRWMFDIQLHWWQCTDFCKPINTGTFKLNLSSLSYDDCSLNMYSLYRESQQRYDMLKGLIDGDSSDSENDDSVVSELSTVKKLLQRIANSTPRELGLNISL